MLTNTEARSAAHPLAASPYVSVKTITIDALTLFMANLCMSGLVGLSAENIVMQIYCIGWALARSDRKKRMEVSLDTGILNAFFYSTE
jgi:hypothetical protein